MPRHSSRLLATLLAALLIALGSGHALGAAPRLLASNLAQVQASEKGVSLGDILLFVAQDAEHGTELWRTDGTPAGTFLLKDINPGIADSLIRDLVVAGGLVFFTALVDDGLGQEIWRSDGTAAGTFRVSDLPQDPNTLWAAGSHAYVSTLGVDGISIWRADGTVSGTHKVKGGFAYYPRDFTAAAGTVFFAVDDGVHGEELWKTDGTEQGTVLVKDLRPGPQSDGPYQLRSVNGYLLFWAAVPNGPSEIWRSDGTDAGTLPFKQLPGAPDFIYADLNSTAPLSADTLLFAAETQDAGSELWRTDGTPAGTWMVKDIFAGSQSSLPREFATHGGVAVFTAREGGAPPWYVFRSDGTFAGTARIPAPGFSADNVFPIPLGGALGDLFVHTSGTNSDAIWSTDGTSGGTQKRFEVMDGEGYEWFRPAPRGLYYSVLRFTASGSMRELWFLPAADPAGDDDGDGMPNGVEAAEGRDPATKDNDVFADARLFAMQQYRDFLGREGDPAGIDTWSGQVSGALLTRAQVVEAFFDSAEFQNGLPQITRLYFAFFNRIPDYPGLVFHTGRYRVGVPLNTIAQDFAGSQEFLVTYGALDNGQYVDLVYQNVLGRPADPDGRANALAQLDGGAMTRGELMAAFSESTEHLSLSASEVFVTAVYVGMLRRSPDPNGLQNWVNAFSTGMPRVQMLEAFLNSAEYHNRFLP